MKFKQVNIMAWSLVDDNHLKIGNDNIAILAMLNYDSETNQRAIVMIKNLLNKTMPRPLAILINNHERQRLEKEILIKCLNLSTYNAPYDFFEINAVNGEGVPQVFEWLEKQLVAGENNQVDV